MTKDKTGWVHSKHIQDFASPIALSAGFLLVLEEQDGRFAGVIRMAEETFEAAISSAFAHIFDNPNISGAILYKISEERYMDIIIKDQDKPRTLEIRLNGVIIATIPRSIGGIR